MIYLIGFFINQINNDRLDKLFSDHGGSLFVSLNHIIINHTRFQYIQYILLLIQPQYSPMPVEQQIAILYCGTHGLLHDVPLDKVQDFERSFIESLQLNHQEDVLDILKTGVIDDNVIKAIEETAAMVTKQFI